MRKVMAVSVLCTILGYAGVHFAFFAKPAPAPQAEEPAAVHPQEVVLANVVEVTDTEALLDPRPVAEGGVPFDAEPVGFRVRAAVEPIPPAAEYEADEAAVAPMPHEVSTRKPLDARRIAWYGDQVIPRQTTEGLKASAITGGIGFYF